MIPSTSIIIKLFLLPLNIEQSLSVKNDPNIAPIGTILVTIPSYKANLSYGHSLT
jgi:hypothetical protein